MLKLLISIRDYVERNEYYAETNYGRGKTLAQMIEANQMPSFYEKLVDQINTLEDDKKKEPTFFLTYPNKFTLFMESEVPDELEPGLYYVMENVPEYKAEVEGYISEVLSRKEVAPSGIRYGKKWQWPAMNDLGKLWMSLEKTLYFYHKNINPVTVKNDELVLWGIKLNYPKLEHVRIAAIVCIMTVAYYISAGCSLEEIQPILQRLINGHYMYEGEVQFDVYNNNLIVFDFRVTQLVLVYAISKTREEWKEYYKELTSIFVREV